MTGEAGRERGRCILLDGIIGALSKLSVAVVRHPRTLDLVGGPACEQYTANTRGISSLVCQTTAQYSLRQVLVWMWRLHCAIHTDKQSGDPLQGRTGKVSAGTPQAPSGGRIHNRGSGILHSMLDLDSKHRRTVGLRASRLASKSQSPPVYVRKTQRSNTRWFGAGSPLSRTTLRQPRPSGSGFVCHEHAPWQEHQAHRTECARNTDSFTGGTPGDQGHRYALRRIIRVNPRHKAPKDMA